MEPRKKTQWEVKIEEDLKVAAEKWWAGDADEAFEAIERVRSEVYRIRRSIKKSLGAPGHV